MTRVLVLFGSIPLFGKERGNMQAMRVLRDEGVEVLFATNKVWGHEAIEPALDAIGMPWRPMTFARPLRRTMSTRDVLKVGRDVVKGWWELARIIRSFRPTHIHLTDMTQVIYSLPVIKLSGLKTVYRLGDDPVFQTRVHRSLWHRLVVPAVATFVCVSDFIRRRVLATGVRPENARVIYSYPPERSALSTSFAPTDDFEGRTVVYMGQLSEEKGVDLLVEAALRICRDHENVRFLIAGDYTWENAFARSLIDRVVAEGLDARIRFLGYVDDIPALLAAGDVHTCPSVCNEALSNGVLEAKLAGVPTVIFPSGGLPEMVRHLMDGYVCEAKTSAALESGLRYYLGLDEGALDAAKREARASLEHLGITKHNFTRAWLDVYGERPPALAPARNDAALGAEALVSPLVEPHSTDA